MSSFSDVVIGLVSSVLDKRVSNKETISCHDLHEQLRFVDSVLGVDEKTYTDVYSKLLVKYEV